MKLIALYVYSPTSFKVNHALEGLGKGVVKPADITSGHIVLEPGVYRLPATTKLTPTKGPDFEVVPLADDKHQWPDPPLQARTKFKLTHSEIVAFLSGTGEESVV
jgi:hypothetical protein